MNKRYLRVGLVLGSYLILSLIATYPTWINLSAAIPGPREDNQQNYWTIWWFHRAVAVEHTDPWTCPLLYYPNGFHLGLHDVGPAYTFPGIALAELSDPVVAYNLLILLAFPIAALAMYALARSAGLSGIAAWGSGIVYAFSPYLPVHSQHHLQQTGIHWLPLLALCLGRVRAAGAYHWVGGAVVCFTLAVYSSLYFAVFGFYIAVFVLLWNAWKDRAFLKPLFKKICMFAVLCGAAVVPRLLLIREAMKEGGEYQAPGAMRYSADLLGFFLPPSTHPLWGSLFEDLQLSTAGSLWEYEYLGIGALLLAAAGVAGRRRMPVILWLMFAGFFMLLSLGPMLHAGGSVIMGRPLPYAFLISPVPFFNGIRVPVRFTLLSMIGIGMAAGFGIEYLAGRGKRLLIGIVIGLVIFLDYLQIPFDYIDRPRAPAHGALMNSGSEFGAFIDLPVDDYDTRMRAEYCQTVHGQPIVGGATGRDPGHFLAILDSIPALKGMGTVWDFLYDDARAFDSSTVHSMESLGIDGLVLHKGIMGNRESGSRGVITSFLGKPAFEDDDFIGWHVTRSTRPDSSDK